MYTNNGAISEGPSHQAMAYARDLVHGGNGKLAAPTCGERWRLPSVTSVKFDVVQCNFNSIHWLVHISNEIHTML